MTDLPESWAEVEIVEVLAPHDNGRPFQQGWSPQCENHPAEPGAWGVLKTTAIQHGEFWPHQNKALPPSLDPRPQIEVKLGDVLMTCAGPRNRCGVACLVESTPDRLMMSGKMYRFRPEPDALHPKYLAYLIQRRDTQLEIDRMKTGINDSGLNLTHDRFAQLRVPLPPLAEQHRIVAKIEALFSELDAGQDSLTRAQAQLQLCRQSLLKAAFQGRLTADWRAANPEKLEDPETLLFSIRAERDARYKQALDDWQEALSTWRAGGEVGRKPAKPKRPADVIPIAPEELAGLPVLPKGWSYCRFGEFIDGITAGNSFACDEREPSPEEIGVAKVSAVSWGEYNESESKTCRDPGRIDPELFIREGDFLLSRANTIVLVGACVIVRGVTKRIMLSDKTLRLHFGAGNQSFFLAYLRSVTGRSEIEKRSSGNQESMRNIGQDRIRSIIMPICSEAETEAVITILDQQISGLTQIENEIATALAKIIALRQAILKEAFSGRLVPQDAADEPASALLARLHETATSATPRRKARA